MASAYSHSYQVVNGTQQDSMNERAIESSLEDVHLQEPDEQDQFIPTNRQRPDISQVEDVSEPLNVDHNPPNPTHSSWESSVKQPTPPPPFVAPWQPLTLHPLYLVTLATISIALAIVTFTISIISTKNYGLRDATDGIGFEFAWRFLPTLVAVLYTLLWIPIPTDLTRTQPWVFMSLPGGAKASESLLQEPESLPKVLTNMFRRLWQSIRRLFQRRAPVSQAERSVQEKRVSRNNRWAVDVAVLAALVASLVVNPLSAALLEVDQLHIVQSKDFQILQVANGALQPIDIGDSIYVTTLAAIAYQVSTIAWVGDNYAVMPFWPKDLGYTPELSPGSNLPPQSWNGNTDVYKTQLNCTPLKSVFEHPWVANVSSTANYFVFNQNDTCSLNITSAPYTESNVLYGGTWDSYPRRSSACGDYLIFTTPNATSNSLAIKGSTIVSYSDNYTYYLGYHCTTTYLTAHIPVEVSISASGSTVSVDDEVFSKNSKPMDNGFMNGTTFDAMFVSEVGNNHLVYQGLPLQGIAKFIGPAMALAAAYQQDPDRVFASTNVTVEAQQVKQRFFGNVLWNELIKLDLTKFENTTAANSTTTAVRLVAGQGVGISLGVLLILLAACALLILLTTRQSRRPMQLKHDPSTAASAALMVHESSNLNCFGGLEKLTDRQIQNVLGDCVFEIRRGKLRCVDDQISESSGTAQTSRASHLTSDQSGHRSSNVSVWHGNRDWRPLILRKWSGATFFGLLVAIIVILAAIYSISIHKGLYQSGFVYQATVILSGSTYYLAPYSIIPTLVAAVISLCWQAIQDPFQRWTPFLAMAHGPQKPSQGATLSYVNTPIMWITGVALHKKHWILALVTSGAVLTQFLQVTTSALWSRNLGAVSQNVELTQGLELRSVARAFSGHDNLSADGPSSDQDPSTYAMLLSLLGGTDYYKSWLFNSLVELSFNGSTPAWSKDEWGFIPVDLSNILQTIDPSVLSAAQASSDSTDGPQVNVTFASLGIRGSIECSFNQSYIISQDLSNASFWDVSKNPNGTRFGYEIPNIRFTGLPINENGTTPGMISIGQWLPPNYEGLTYSANTETLVYDPKGPTNFTIIWIEAGYPTPYYDKAGENTHYIFKSMPNMKTLTCVPIFEKANVSITVRASDGHVLSYELLKGPLNATEAWSDDGTKHYSSADVFGVAPLKSWNITYSWGYLFQMALLEASNAFEIDRTGSSDASFSFKETDSYLDFYSYSARTIASKANASLLDTEILANVSRTVFSSIFKSFISLPNGYDGYWAYQKLNDTLPPGLDFDETPSIKTSTYSTVETDTSYSWSATGTSTAIYTLTEVFTLQTTDDDGTRTVHSLFTSTHTDIVSLVTHVPVATSTLSTTWTATFTSYTTPSAYMKSTPAAATVFSTSSHKARRQINTTPTKVSQQSSSITPSSSSQATFSSQSSSSASSGPNSFSVQATVSVQLLKLTISKAALFLSLSILIYLALSTLPIYIMGKSYTHYLPRDINNPGSLLALVYASTRLQSWAAVQDEFDDEWMRQTHPFKKYSKRKDRRWIDSHVLIGMGSFVDEDEKTRWGIEINAHPEIDATLGPNLKTSQESSVRQTAETTENEAWVENGRIAGEHIEQYSH